jgi:lipid II:glycine glycyltransferase (peptidoglycan interpeptide bridge formation enzyme)
MAAYDLFRRKQRYIGPPGDLIRHIRNASGGSDKSGGVRVWNAIHDSAPVAGIAVVCHNASATYLAAWTSRDGRQRHAHNLLLWRAITELRKNGTDWLDLGGVDTQSSPGLARFTAIAG